MQSKLLRALQNQEVQKVGSPSVHRVDVRVVAATNRDLPAMIAAKEFREDLYYRLCVVEIRLPRLADRKEDLPLLEQHFLRRFSTQYSKSVTSISRRAQTVLARYGWPGNVRELENVLSSAAMLIEGPTIDVRDLPERFRCAEALADTGAPLTLAEVERRHVRQVLQQVGGNKVKAAQALGISRMTLYRMLEEEPDTE